LDFDSPYGYLVSGSADKSLMVWDLSKFEGIGSLEGHTGRVRCVQLDGYNVISGSGDQTAKLWNLSNLCQSTSKERESLDASPCIKTFVGHTGGVTCLQLDGPKLLTGSIDRTVRHWDVETGETLAILRSELGVEALENDVSRIIHGSREVDSPTSNMFSDAEIHAWDDSISIISPNKRQSSGIYNTSGYVGSLHFWEYALAAGFGDGSIRMFDLRNNECHRVLSGHIGAVTSCKFDNNLLISGSIDKTVKVSPHLCRFGT
jgi:division protein 1